MELRRKLFWLAAIRILAITLLLAGGSYFLFLSRQEEAEQAVKALSGLVVAVSALQIAIALSLRRGWKLSRLAGVQVAGDVAFAVILLYLTGVSESLFSFVLPLVAVSGGALLGVRGSWIASVGAFISYSLLLLLVQKGVLSPLGMGTPTITNKALLEGLFVHGSAIFLTAGLVSYVLNQARRAGERAEAAESSLLHLHVLHDSIVRSIGSGILTTDIRGRITFVNRAGEEILGVRREKLRGTPLEEVFPSLGEEVAERQRPETEWRTPEGGMRLLGFAHTPLLGPAGEPLGTAAVFQDLTDLRELEERAARSERLAVVGELAAGLAHELRNPLASMCGAIEMLEAEKMAEDRPLLRIVMREAERLNRLVSEFLDFAAPKNPRLEAVDLSALAKSSLEVFRHEPAARGLEVEARLEPAVALADEDQLRQVLWNLLLNAAQASLEGHRIDVFCGTAEGGRVLLSVEDQGCGISSHALEKIFDPFFTTKERGSGLGLPVVHRVVESLGGELSVSSKVGEGTRFSISLPEAPAGRQEEAALGVRE